MAAVGPLPQACGQKTSPGGVVRETRAIVEGTGLVTLMPRGTGKQVQGVCRYQVGLLGRVPSSCAPVKLDKSGASRMPQRGPRGGQSHSRRRGWKGGVTGPGQVHNLRLQSNPLRLAGLPPRHTRWWSGPQCSSRGLVCMPAAHPGLEAHTGDYPSGAP